MSKNKIIDSLGRIDDDMIERVDTLRQKKKNRTWIKWGALAACLCLVAGFAIPAVFYQTPEMPNESASPSSGPPAIMVDGMKYVISPHISVTDQLPEGFIYGGETVADGGESCPYYVNPDVREWVYVCHEVTTDGTVDASGTLNRTEPHFAYVRYVDRRLRGKDLVCYNGAYYISMWSARTYEPDPDVSTEYYDEMDKTYGIRMEGEAPEGFTSAGIAEFSGHDTIPQGTLSCNRGAYEIYVNPNAPEVVLVAARWFTAPVGENGETSHNGFDVYILYDCPLA